MTAGLTAPSSDQDSLRTANETLEVAFSSAKVDSFEHTLAEVWDKVSGCGKTRSVIETLCLQWGFYYFNAAKSDFGSSDLSQLAGFIDTKTNEEQSPAQNTAFARNMTLVLFLRYCLQIPDCRQTFSSASWAVLQVCPHMFKDVSSELFSKLYGRLEGFTIFESTLRPIVRHELLSVREILAAHAYPNFSSESTLRLVVDEAQVLSDKAATNFQSSYLETDPRPMLSLDLYAQKKKKTLLHIASVFLTAVCTFSWLTSKIFISINIASSTTPTFFCVCSTHQHSSCMNVADILSFCSLCDVR